MSHPKAGFGDPALKLRHGWLAALLISTFLPVAALAQSIHWDPPGGQLGFNQVSQIALVFENCEPDGSAQLPQVDGLVFGRASQSSQTSIVNFSMTRTYSLIFPVRPTKRSAIVIPAFDIKTDKGSVHVAAANYSVGDATVGNSGVPIDDVASAKLSTPKNTFWAGEVFKVTFDLSILRRYYHSMAPNVDWPATPFVAEEWPKPDPTEAIVGGERRVVSSQSTRAYTKQPGTYTLNPASQTVNLMVGTTGFGLFSQPNVEQRQIESNSLPVTIKPLPAAPADFSGAVGDFTFTSKVVPTTAAVGEPITWTIDLSGTGNWPDVAGLPSREVSNDFQVVQPKSKRTLKDNALFEGTLSEDVVLVPSRPGTYRLAPVRFTYFDTKSGSYKTVASEPVTVTVTASAPATTPASNPGAPVQFSIAAPPSGTAAAPNLPAAVPPVPPENLPRDPVTESGHGLVPFPLTRLWLVVAAPALGLVLVVWLVLAALRSRENDPQRMRRTAREKIAAILHDLGAAGNQAAGVHPLLRAWQQATVSLWEVPHAAPGAPLVQTSVNLRQKEGAESWAALWNDADRALHARENTLPPDWISRAQNALQSASIPGWPPFSLFGGRNLLPFLFTIALIFIPLKLQADAGGDAYRAGDFPAAEQNWKTGVTTAPSDWSLRHNLGLALAQQDRWAEATAQWTSAILLNPRSETTRWDLALGLQRSGMAPAELVELSRGEGRFKLARLAAPGEWQLALVGAGLLLAGALIVLLLQGYRRIGGWAKPAALLVSLFAVGLGVAATLSLHSYGTLAHPDATLVWKTSVLRSIPTDVDTTQKSSPLSAGSVAIAEKTFLGWTKLRFPGGQTGWAHTEDLHPLYR